MVADKTAFPGVEHKSLENLMALDEYVRLNYDALMDKFMTQFEQYCRKIALMQEAGNKGAISFIHFSVLRTNILTKRHILRLDAYDENWYADRVECDGTYNVHEFYVWLDKFAESIETAQRTIYKNAKLNDVHRIVFEESNKYLFFVAELIRAGMKKAAGTEWFQGVKRNAVFVVCIGGYQDKSDILYKEDSTVKDANEVKRRLEAKHKPAYSHEICENVNLSGGDYGGISLLYSDFTGCDFSGSSFRDTVILFSSFKQTVLKNVDMEKTKIVDADFSGAVLEDVSFKDAELNYLSFASAKLTNVRFDDVLYANNLDFESAELIDTVIPEKLPSR